MKRLLLLAFLVAQVSAQDTLCPLVPKPVKFERRSGEFVVGTKTVIAYHLSNKDVKPVAEYLAAKTDHESTEPILLQQALEIGADETAPELARRLAAAGAPLVVETLRKLDRSEITPVPQDHTQATLAPMLKKEDGRIRWSLPAPQIYNHIRGLEPWPGAFTTFRGQLCHVWGSPTTGFTAPESSAAVGAPPGTLLAEKGTLYVACDDLTWLELEAVQLEGRKRVSGRDFANGARLTWGEQFHS